MQIDRNVEPLGALEDRPEALVVEEDAVCQAVDHGALEAELDGAFELVGGGRGIARRQRCEGGEAPGMRGNRGIEPVVDAPGQLDRDIGGDLLRGGRAVREHLHVDPGLVHLLDAQFAEVVETFRRCRRRARPSRPVKCFAISASQ